jgi:Ner family transcriptional regulator
MQVTSSSTGWDWPDVKCELEKRGKSFAGIARKLGVSRHAVAKVKNWPSKPVQAAIARELKRRPEDIWPDRYRDMRRAA